MYKMYKMVEHCTEVLALLSTYPPTAVYVIFRKWLVLIIDINTWGDVDAQAGQRLCCSQTTEDRFSRVEALYYYYCAFLKVQ